MHKGRKYLLFFKEEFSCKSFVVKAFTHVVHTDGSKYLKFQVKSIYYFLCIRPNAAIDNICLISGELYGNTDIKYQ